MQELVPVPLTASNFTEFGSVIETENAEQREINAGTTIRFHDLAKIDVSDNNGHPIVSIFRGVPRTFPLEIVMLERHPLGSQAFYPLGNQPYIVVVASSGQDGLPETLRAFYALPSQGVNYNKGVWHHPLICCGSVSEFLVIDREGEGDNLEEFRLPNHKKSSLVLPRD